ncbi:MAG TPA: ROK family protein [Solirubrobacterales bacterium]|nr:ROK family protein [Solirubrobacterales bacterium]
MRYGGIEAGGTTWTCAVTDGAGSVEEVESFPTTSPGETLDRAASFFQGTERLESVGIGCFGPIDLRIGSAIWGRITTTPKPGWADVDVVGALAEKLDVPFAFDTDVNASAVGEATWGAAVGLKTFCYVTVGTGIGAGLVANGEVLHGLLHPELGHVRVPHDFERDPFAGSCPFHGDCLEGLASGEALRARWGRPAEELQDEHQVWDLEADYLALALTNLVCTISPELIIIGGGVANSPTLLPLIREKLGALSGGYVGAEQFGCSVEEFVVLPALGPLAGVLGAAELGRRRTQGVSPSKDERETT